MSGLFLTWCSSHMITNKLLGCGLTAISCVALLNGYKPAGITDTMIQEANMDGRSLLSMEDAPSDDVFPIWIFMSIGILIEMSFFFDALCKPDQELGILMITINRMLVGDILKFMKVFMMSSSTTASPCTSVSYTHLTLPTT